MASYDKHLLDGEHLGYLVSKIKAAIATKITNPSTKSNGQFLKYNGTDWVASDIPDSGVLSVTAKDGTIVVDNTDPDNPKVGVGTITLAKVSDSGTAAGKDFTTQVTQSSNALVTSGGVYEAVKDLTGFHFEIVSTLPATGQPNIIYLVLKSSSETGNIYTEYAWINSKWEQLGDTQLTLEYLTNGEIDTIWDAAE